MASIIVTIGPKSIDPKILRGLKKAGADRFRINLSHSNPESLEEYFNIFEEEGITPAIDTQGAQLRVNRTSITKFVEIGSFINLYFKEESIEETYENYILLNHPEVCEQIFPGDIMKVDFQGLALEIIEQTSEFSFRTKVISPGTVLKNRAVDIQSKSLRLSILTNFDKDAISYSLSRGVKELYASFVSDSLQIKMIREKIGNEVKLISKIETSAGVANISEILEHSDEILIDRGDLSREISITSIPMAVFNIIEIAKRNNKGVCVATNVLDSMMSSRIPSRAEISDIYSHLSAGVSGIVLAAEVAIGENPISTTALLKYLIDSYENYKNGFHGIGKIDKPAKELIGEELFNWL